MITSLLVANRGEIARRIFRSAEQMGIRCVAVFVDADDHFPNLPPDLPAILDRDRDQIIAAVVSCPMAAISLTFEDGRVLTSEDWEKEDGLRRWIDY